MNSYRDVVGSPMMTMRGNLGARTHGGGRIRGAMLQACVRTPSGVLAYHTCTAGAEKVPALSGARRIAIGRTSRTRFKAASQMWG